MAVGADAVDRNVEALPSVGSVAIDIDEQGHPVPVRVRTGDRFSGARVEVDVSVVAGNLELREVVTAGVVGICRAAESRVITLHGISGEVAVGGLHVVPLRERTIDVDRTLIAW
ncbi:hypothetical protein ABN034_11635 [Actinopolymorpha sp. B11F2]|uniref:hypothetical protein n=1 Tax=Actinopolymorpha sp. B11F2 TaxID=3160862 RepID=UPI0032E450DC